MAAIERRLAVLVPPVAAAAFAALKLLAQLCNLGWGSFTSKCGERRYRRRQRNQNVLSELLLGLTQQKLTSLSWSVLPQEAERL